MSTGAWVPTPDAFAVQCVSVYDGDTISVEYRGNVDKVRLVGVERVEMKKGKWLAAQAQEYRVDEKVISQLGALAKSYTSKRSLDKEVLLVLSAARLKCLFVKVSTRMNHDRKWCLLLDIEVSSRRVLQVDLIVVSWPIVTEDGPQRWFDDLARSSEWTWEVTTGRLPV